MYIKLLKNLINDETIKIKVLIKNPFDIYINLDNYDLIMDIFQESKPRFETKLKWEIYK